MKCIGGALILLAALGAAPAAAQEAFTSIASLETYKPSYFLQGQPDTKIQVSLKLRLVQDFHAQRLRFLQFGAGFGASQDTYKISEPSPSGHSYGKAISNALKDANLPPAAVDLLIPCGLGIPAHDRAELNGLTTVFGGGLSRIPITTIKPRTGNMAAGTGVEAAAAVLSMHHGKIPAAVNTKNVQGRDAKLNVAVSSVYSLGGQNAALVFKSL